MSNDIVTLLRSPDRFEPHTCNAAADEIERLREELRSYTGDKHSTREPSEPSEPFTPEAL